MGKTKVDFGTQIKQVRLKHKMTQAEFGEILGKAPTTIHGYETNTITPPFDVLLNISSIFNISVGDLMGLKSESLSAQTIRELYDAYMGLIGEEDE